MLCHGRDVHPMWVKSFTKTVTNQGIGPRQTNTESLRCKGNERRTHPVGFPTGVGPDRPQETHTVTS